MLLILFQCKNIHSLNTINKHKRIEELIKEIKKRTRNKEKNKKQSDKRHKEVLLNTDRLSYSLLKVFYIDFFIVKTTHTISLDCPAFVSG